MKRLLIPFFLFAFLGVSLPQAANPGSKPSLLVAEAERQPQQEATTPTETGYQSTALELLDAPNLPEKPLQIIHEGQTTSDGETLPPIIEERIPPSSNPVEPPQIKAAQQQLVFPDQMPPIEEPQP